MVGKVWGARVRIVPLDSPSWFVAANHVPASLLCQRSYRPRVTQLVSNLDNYDSFGVSRRTHHISSSSKSKVLELNSQGEKRWSTPARKDEPSVWAHHLNGTRPRTWTCHHTLTYCHNDSRYFPKPPSVFLTFLTFLTRHVIGISWSNMIRYEFQVPSWALPNSMKIMKSLSLSLSSA